MNKDNDFGELKAVYTFSTNQGQKFTNNMTLNDYAAECHAANHKWWHDAQGNKLERNKGEMLCLMHSEISEAMEGERKSLMDDKLPHRRMAEVELADLIIRAFDYAAAHGYDLDGAYIEKMAFNASREDHKHEARETVNGKNGKLLPLPLNEKQ